MFSFQYLFGAMAAVLTAFYAKDAGNYALDRYNTWKTISYTAPLPPPPPAYIPNHIDRADTPDTIFVLRAVSIPPPLPPTPNHFLEESPSLEADIHPVSAWSPEYRELVVVPVWMAKLRERLGNTVNFFAIIFLSIFMLYSAIWIWTGLKATLMKVFLWSTSRQARTCTDFVLVRDITPTIAPTTIAAVEAQEAAKYEGKLRGIKRTMARLRGDDWARSERIRKAALARQASNLQGRFDEAITKKDREHAILDCNYNWLEWERDSLSREKHKLSEEKSGLTVLLNLHRIKRREQDDLIKNLRKDLKNEREARQEELEGAIGAYETNLELNKQLTRKNDEAKERREEDAAKIAELEREAQILKSEAATAESENARAAEKLHEEIAILESEVDSIKKLKEEMEEDNEKAVSEALDATLEETDLKNKALAEVAALKQKVEALEASLPTEASVTPAEVAVSPTSSAPSALPASQAPSASQSSSATRDLLLSQALPAPPAPTVPSAPAPPPASLTPETQQAPPARLPSTTSPTTKPEQVLSGLPLPHGPPPACDPCPARDPLPSHDPLPSCGPPPSHAPRTSPVFPPFRGGEFRALDLQQAPLFQPRSILTPRRRLAQPLSFSTDFSFTIPSTITTNVPEAVDTTTDFSFKVPSVTARSVPDIVDSTTDFSFTVPSTVAIGIPDIVDSTTDLSFKVPSVTARSVPEAVDSTTNFSFTVPSTVTTSIPEVVDSTTKDNARDNKAAKTEDQKIGEPSTKTKAEDGVDEVPKPKEEANKAEVAQEHAIAPPTLSTPSASREQVTAPPHPITPSAPQEQATAPPIPSSPSTVQQLSLGRQTPPSTTGVKKKGRRGGKKYQKKKAAVLRRAAADATTEDPRSADSPEAIEVDEGVEDSIETDPAPEAMSIKDNIEVDEEVVPVPEPMMIEADRNETGETAIELEAMVTDDNVGPSIEALPALEDQNFWEHNEDYSDLYLGDDDEMKDSPPHTPEQDAVMDDGEVPVAGDDEEMKDEWEDVDQEMLGPGIQPEQGDVQLASNAPNQTQPATFAPVPATEEEQKEGWEDSLKQQMERLTIQSEPQDLEYALVVANVTQPPSQVPAPAPAAQESYLTNANIRPPWLEQTTTPAYAVVTGTHIPTTPNIVPAPAAPNTLAAPHITTAIAAIPTSTSRPASASPTGLAAPPFVPQASTLSRSLAPPYYPPTLSARTLAPPYAPSTSISPLAHSAPYGPIYGSTTATDGSFSNPAASIGPKAYTTSVDSLLGLSPTTHPAPPGPFASSSHLWQPSQPVNIPGLMFPAQSSMTAAVPYGQTTAPPPPPSSPSSSESSPPTPPPISTPYLLPSPLIGQPAQRTKRPMKARPTVQMTASALPPQHLLSTEPVQLPGLQTQYTTPEFRAESKEASEAQPSIPSTPSAKSSSTEAPYSPFSPSTPQGECVVQRSSISNVSSPIISPRSPLSPEATSPHWRRVILPMRRRKTKEILASLPPPPPPLFVAPPAQSTGTDSEAASPLSPTYQQPPSTPPHVPGPGEFSFSLQASDNPSAGAIGTSETADEPPKTPPNSPPLSDLSPGPPLPDDSKTKKRSYDET